MPQPKTDMDKVSDFWKHHKILSVLIILVLLFVGYYAFKMFFPYGIAATSIGSYDGKLGVSESYAGDYEGRGIAAQDYSSAPSEYQIKTASLSIDSDDAASDSERTRTKVLSLDGKVDSENKYETEETITYYLTVKVPSAELETFVVWAKETFEIDSASVQYYTESVKYQLNEIKTLQDALAVYDKMLAEVKAKPASAETAQLIFDITNQKLQVIRQLNQYGFDISQTQERADEATVSLSFTEDKPVELLPEEFGREFMLDLKEAIAVVLGIFGGIFIVLAKALKWAIYIAIFALVFAFGYRFARKHF